MAMLFSALGATGLMAGAVGSGEGMLGGPAGTLVGKSADYQTDMIQMIFGKSVADTVRKFLAGGAPSEESINAALKKINETPVPPGTLGGPMPAEALPEREIAAGGFGVTREEGKAPKYTGGEAYTKAQKFEDSMTRLNRKRTEAAHWGGMAQSRADKLEMQINKRPYADNKGLLKMMKSREQEAKRHKQTEEKSGAEYAAVRIKQQELDTDLAKQYQQSMTKQLDTAFDGIESMWQSAIKSDKDDLGQEQWTQYVIAQLVPYLDQIGQMSGHGSRDETVQALQVTVESAWEDPKQLAWLKVALQGS